MSYDCFISYSQKADKIAVNAIQKSLEALGKRWFQKVSLNVFRDDTNLSYNTALSIEIEQALMQSTWLLYIASEHSAASDWVNHELKFWVEHKSPRNIMIVLYRGTISWDRKIGDFDKSTTTAIAPSLFGVFKDEPLYLDLTWSKNRKDLKLKNNKFQNAMRGFAAPMHWLAKNRSCK